MVAAWAADCAEGVLGLFEFNSQGDSRPRDAIARTRAFARGELDVAEEIRRRFVGVGAARAASTGLRPAASVLGHVNVKVLSESSSTRTCTRQ
jgi:hypothetical protein